MYCILLCLKHRTPDVAKRCCEMIRDLLTRDDNPCWLEQQTFDDLTELTANSRNIGSMIHYIAMLNTQQESQQEYQQEYQQESQQEYQQEYNAQFKTTQPLGTVNIWSTWMGHY